MGIQNRDYFRGDEDRGYTGSYGSVSSAGDWVIKWAIGICVVVFFLQNLTTNDPGLQTGITEHLDLDPVAFTEGQFWRVLTYGICHGGPSHLFFNMIGLWCFGRVIEHLFGSRETIAFLVGSTIVSGLIYVIAAGLSDSTTPAVGASGGIFAVVILTAFLYPKMPVYLMFIPIPIQLRFLAIVFVGYDLLNVLQDQSLSPGVASSAHLGGAAFGAFYFLSGFRFFKQSVSYGGGSGGSSGIGNAVTSFFSRLKPRPQNKNVRIYAPPEPEDLDRELDRILDKINQQGKASLTKDEEAFLLRVSQIKARERNRS